VLSLPSNFWRNSKTSFQAPKTSTYWYTCWSSWFVVFLPTDFANVYNYLKI
jgi:hypothetical protein